MTRANPTVDERQLVLQMIEEAYQLPNWNETSLSSTLKRVGPAMAGWRPRGGKHSIADIVVHCAYWKYGLRRRLCGGKRGRFPIKGTNWFETPARLDAKTWSQYVALLEEEHEQLCEAIRTTTRKIRGTRTNVDGHWSLFQRTFWLAIHDGYHTGQINMIKAMHRRTKSPKSTA